MSKVKKLSKEVKLTEDELTSLRTAIKEVNDVQMQIGGVEAHKHELLHSIVIKTSELKDIQKTLEDVYGSVTINLETGVVTDGSNS
jgi:hypothetical protein